MKKADYSKTVAAIRETGQLYSAKIKARAEELGIRNAYRQLLSALAVKDGDTQLSLVERTGLKAPTVSITLRKMEKEGLVRRETDENDLRKTHVYLTEKGRDANKTLENKIASVQKEIFASLSDEEYEVFCGALEKINKALE